jgi:ankyrin repeat protein
LAKQLILQDERGFGQLTEFCRNHTMSDDTRRAHTPEELCQLIRKLSEYFETAMIVVDGLDEITNDRAGVTRLLRSLNTVGGNIKTLFASRPEIDIGYQLEEFFQVSIAAMSSDLRLYVASEIERRTKERKLRIRDPNLKDHIMTTLVDGADGMCVIYISCFDISTDEMDRFRWVSCQMDYLCECNNDRDRREALKKLPPDLPSSYERILERVNRSNKENRDLVMKTLHWIVYSLKTLTTTELLHALAVRDGERHFDSYSMTTVEDVLYWCSSLVRRSKDANGEELLELAHFTVKEFLEAIDAVQTPCYKQYCLSGDHSILAKACLNFMLCQEFDESPRPKYDNDFEQWIEESDNFCDNYSFSDYASLNWSDHVHDSNWEVINTCVLEFFNAENAFAFWTLRWLQGEYGAHENDDITDSRYFEKASSPTALHWAAVFALDKVCAILIEKGMSVSQQSVMGTPLNCTIVSEYAVYKASEIEVVNPIESRSIWRRSERQSVLRQLINTGLDLDKMVNAEGQCTAMSVALEMEKWHYDPFMVSTLFDAGAKISAEDFRHLEDHLRNMFDSEDTPKDTATLCGITVPCLIKAATAQTTALVQGAEFEFFSFSLEVLSRGWSIECFHPFFEVKFSEVFAANGGVELDEIVRDNSIDPQSKLVKLLSTAIRNNAPTKEKADSKLHDSLGSTVSYENPSIMALLFQYNPGLSAFGLKLPGYDDQELYCLHWVLREWTSTEQIEGVIRLLISHGASVTNPDHKGITAIELAAEDFDLEIFQVMWDSAMSSMAFDTSPELLKKILYSAIKHQNEPILKFLARKILEGKFMPTSSMLEFAVGQETSTLLKSILEQEHDVNCYRTDSCIFEGKMQEESEEDCYRVLECGGDHGNRYVELNIDTTAGRMSYHHEALYLAANPNGSLTNFKFLVKVDLPASHRNHNGHTILHILAANHHKNSLVKLQYLVEKSRVMLDLLDSDHLTPLALAVRSRNIRGMEILLDAGANLDTLLVDNQTALHIACYSGNKAAAEALLTRGCHTSQKDLQGQTPMDLALACGYQEIATTIQNFIDSDLTRNSSHTFGAKIERLSTITTSNFAQTDDHGSLPLRTVQEDLDSDHDSEDGINANNFTTNIGNDRIAESSKQSTDSVRRSHLPQTNISEDFASPSLKRHTSNGDEYQLQLSTKRAKSS